MRKLGGFRLKKLFNWNMSIPMRRVVGGEEIDEKQESINMYNPVLYTLYGGRQSELLIEWKFSARADV